MGTTPNFTNIVFGNLVTIHGFADCMYSGITPHVVQEWRTWVPQDVSEVSFAYLHSSDQKAVKWRWRNGTITELVFEDTDTWETITGAVKLAMKMGA